MFDWKNTEAIIPAVVSIAERADSLRQLLVDLSIQCPGISATVIPQWKQSPRSNPRSAFESIAKGLQGMSSPWVFYMEEDIKLSTKFGELVPEVLNKIPDECGAVSFFSPNKTEQKLVRLNGSSLNEAGEPFTYAQCVAMKLKVALAWKNMILPWWDAAPSGKKRAPDMALGDCCKDLGLKILIYLPNLVQHRCIESGFGHSNRPKSYTFIDDLNNV